MKLPEHVRNAEVLTPVAVHTQHGGGMVDVGLGASHASSTWMAMAMQCNEHDGGSPHLQHDPMAVAVSGTTTV